MSFEFRLRPTLNFLSLMKDFCHSVELDPSISSNAGVTDPSVEKTENGTRRRNKKCNGNERLLLLLRSQSANIELAIVRVGKMHFAFLEFSVSIPTARLTKPTHSYPAFETWYNHGCFQTWARTVELFGISKILACFGSVFK